MGEVYKAEACLQKTALEESPFGHSSNKNRYEAIRYLWLSGFLINDDYPRRITKACQLPVV